jgi:hypothetical protein
MEEIWELAEDMFDEKGADLALMATNILRDDPDVASDEDQLFDALSNEITDIVRDTELWNYITELLEDLDDTESEFDAAMTIEGELNSMLQRLIPEAFAEAITQAKQDNTNEGFDMKIFEVAGVGKLHGLTVMSLDKFVDRETEEQTKEGKLNEFAPGDGSEGSDEETLHKYARMWYNGDDAVQQKVEQILDRMGWEIGEIESEEGGAFVVQAGDINGNTYIGFNVEDLTESLSEAPGDFGLGANYRAIPDDEMQALMGRSKNKAKTKRDKFDYPYIHGSNIEVKDEAGKTFDTEKLKAAIMQRPKSILGQNAKMQHSETGDEAIFDIGLPALKGLAVNEKTGEFVVVDTCPGAGACQTYCYAMKGSYVMFKAVSMGLARMLNFLLNDPAGFASQLNKEIAAAKAKLAKKNAKMTVRWHDAGDFFSPEYLAMAYSVAEANPDIGFYAYTKMGDVANAARPKNFNMNFSQGAKRGQEKKVDIVRTKHSKVVPKDMFFDLIARKGNELIKDAKGRMQFASPENLEQFKADLSKRYAIDKNSILTYDQMMKTPVGDAPKWNVIVMPGDGDNSANRNDVVGSYLLFH